MARRPESSAATAARFMRFYTARNGAPPAQIERIEQRRRTRLKKLFAAPPQRAFPSSRVPLSAKVPLSMRADVEVFRECVLRHVGHFPRSGHDIRQDVIDDYGSHTERRFWRALALHVRARLVEKTADGYRLARTTGRAGGPA